MYDGTRVDVGPGTLYAAPLGTTEPTSVTGTWPAGWTSLGYTDAGSTFSLNPTVASVEVEESYWPVRNVITAYAGTLTFALAEETLQNWLLALNAGIGSSQLAAAHGTSGTDSSIWAEVPDIGTEVRVMLGWDALNPSLAGTPFGRLVVRQALQTGTVTAQRRKGANKTSLACTFTFEKPATTQPFRFWTTPQRAA